MSGLLACPQQMFDMPPGSPRGSAVPAAHTAVLAQGAEVVLHVPPEQLPAAAGDPRTNSELEGLCGHAPSNLSLDHQDASRSCESENLVELPVWLHCLTVPGHCFPLKHSLGLPRPRKFLEEKDSCYKSGACWFSSSACPVDATQVSWQIVVLVCCSTGPRPGTCSR